MVYGFGKRKSHFGGWENFLKSKRACAATFAFFNFDFGSVYISAILFKAVGAVALAFVPLLSFWLFCCSHIRVNVCRYVCIEKTRNHATTWLAENCEMVNSGRYVHKSKEIDISPYTTPYHTVPHRTIFPAAMSNCCSECRRCGMWYLLTLYVLCTYHYYCNFYFYLVTFSRSQKFWCTGSNVFHCLSFKLPRIPKFL